MESMVFHLLHEEQQQQHHHDKYSQARRVTAAPSSQPQPHDASRLYLPASPPGLRSPVQQEQQPPRRLSPDSTMPPVSPPPSADALEHMARLCLERVAGRPEGMVRRTELGIALRDAMGAVYQKGWVNLALAELEHKGLGRLTPDGVFFRTTSSPLSGALASLQLRHEGAAAPGFAAAMEGLATSTTPTSSSSSTSHHATRSRGQPQGQGRKRAFLLIDGDYYEWLQWHVLQGRTATHAIDVRLLIQRLEAVLGMSFVRRLYVQSTETGARGSFHKMLEAGAGFEVELHRVRDSPTHRGVSVAITAQVLSSTFKATYDAMIVLTGGDSDLAPAFRTAQAESEARFRSRLHVQDVKALGGMRTSPDLFPFLYRPADGSTFIIESLMATCVVPKGELGRASGSSSSSSHQRNARSLSPPIVRGGLPESGLDSRKRGGFGPPPPPSPPKGRSVSYSSFQDGSVAAAHERGGDMGSPLRAACFGLPGLGGSLSSSSGSGGGGVSVGAGIGAGGGGGGRPRRWCNFGHRCKYFEDVEANHSHFQRFVHVCQDDLQCPFVLNYAAHRLTEEGKAHFAMWKHSCPHGLDCQYFAQPDKHRRHIEFFTHKAKVLNAVVQQQQEQQQQQQQQQPQSGPLLHHHLAALSLSPPTMAQPAPLSEADQHLFSRFLGDWDPEVMQQTLHQLQHHSQQQLPLASAPRPPGLLPQLSSTSSQGSTGTLQHLPVPMSGSHVEDDVSSMGSTGSASVPCPWSPDSSPNLWS